jgi:hypothetical protein
MYSELAIWNLALGSLGVELVQDVTDETLQRQLAEALFPVCRDRLIASGYFDFANTRVLFDTLSSAVPEDWMYNYHYDLDDDHLRVLDVRRDAHNLQEEDWEQTGRMLSANVFPALATVAVRTPTEEFPDLFVDALVQLLASELAIPLTKSETLRTTAYNLYIQKLAEAKAYNTAYRHKRDKRMSRSRKARFQ